METVIVGEEGIRLDKFLATQFPTFSRSYFQYLIQEGCILVNGKAWKKKEKTQVGDEIAIHFQSTPVLSLEPEEIPLEILYEDEYLIAINKPAGMVVHPAPGHPRHTFAHALLHHCKTLPGSDLLRPGIVHRLDKETSGVLLGAKTDDTHRRLISLFSERKMKKKYLAICLGKPADGKIEAPICRDPIHRKKMMVSDKGKEAISFCRVIATQGPLSLVEVELITGRTHQIRVHLKHCKTPILGDPLYGSPSANRTYAISRQLLHAFEIAFLHPITHYPLCFQAPPPPDFQTIMVSFGNHEISQRLVLSATAGNLPSLSY